MQFWNQDPIVGMVTCPREVNYARDTLTNISHCGLPAPTIYHDDQKEGPVPGWFNCLKLLRRRASKMASNPPILILQDDLIFKQNPGFFFPLPPRNDALLSLFTVNRPETVREGWQIADTSSQRRKIECDGGLAFVMDSSVAHDLLAWYSIDRKDGKNPRTNLPELLGEYCQLSDIAYYISPKNCVQHTGEVPARDGYPEGFRWNVKQTRPKDRK